MGEGSSIVIALAVLSWGSLAALFAVFLRLALGADAGFGMAGRVLRRRREMPARTGVKPVAIPSRHVVAPQSSRS